MIIRFIQVLLFVCISNIGFSQISMIPQGSPATGIMDRFEIKYGADLNYHTALRPYQRALIMESVDSLYHSQFDLRKKDIALLRYLYRDNNEFYTEEGKEVQYVAGTYAFSQYEKSKKAILRYFYQTPANFFEFDKAGFYARINPLIYFKGGKDLAQDDFVFQNTRGIEVRGGIDDKVFFYTNILENQAGFPEHVKRRIEKDTIIPGQAFFKTYNSQIFGENVGYDYLNAQAYFGANLTKNIQFTFGQGKNFIGNGSRSLLLSDYGQNYLHLRVNTKLWRFHYQNLFMELASTSSKATQGDVALPKKYAAIHYLSYRHKNLFEIGLFEGIIYGREEGFALSYLNPVILYRAVEQYEDSADNVLVGLNANVNLFKTIQLYGQIMLDEFVLDELIVNPNGWWGNKFGIQAGGKYIDVLGVNGLDLLAEFNRVRPYTYSHSFKLSYSHYNQPLAHPLGANFNELLFRINYAFSSRLVLSGSLAWADYGDDYENDPDFGSTNYGGDILQPLSEYGFEQGFGNTIGQGVSTQILNARIGVSYQLAHNIFMDLEYYYRNLDSSLDERDLSSSLIQAGLRVNLWEQQIDY